MRNIELTERECELVVAVLRHVENECFEALKGVTRKIERTAMQWLCDDVKLLVPKFLP